MQKRILTLMAAFGLIMNAQVYAVPHYHVIPIVAGEGNGINQKGDVVGQQAIYTDINTYYRGGHGFLYKNGKLTDLGLYYTPADPVYESTEGLAVNNSDVVVGAINNSGGSLGGTTDGYHDAFIWQNGKLTDIAHGTTNGGQYSYCTGINERGDVCGVFDELQYYIIGDGFGGMHGFMYRNNMLTDLRPLDNSLTAYYISSSVATDINNAGQVVGSSGVGIFNTHHQIIGSDDHAVIWTNGKAKIIGSPSFHPNAINDNGWIAGYDSSGAVLYIYGLTIKIGPGNSVSLNNSGTVIGNTSTGAFLYVIGKMYDLNTLVDGGWKITDVGQINDAWQIAATGTRSGSTVAYALLLTPVGR